MKLQAILFCVLLSFQPIFCSKILAVFPSGSRSTVLVLQELTKELASRGHEVTFVSFFPLEKPVKNHRDIKIENAHDVSSLVTNFLSDSGSASKIAFLKQFPNFLRKQSDSANDTLNDPQFRKIMNEESFDLVIAGFLLNTFIVGLGDHFKCPVIMMGTAGKITALDYLAGNPFDISAVPHLMKPFKGNMSFKQRLQTFMMYTVDFLMNSYIDYVHEEYYNFNFPPDKYISYKQARQNVSLVLTNDHFTFGGPRPLIPGMVEVGGLQAKSQPNPLPEDIKNFMDEAQNGVILFSMGSNAKSTLFPKEKIDIIMKTFANLKQRVIFKWENENLPNKPSNVLTVKWLPQDDILAHPNLKVFITHGGLGGTAEAKYHAVPIVAMPLFGDQMSNVDKAVEEGWAVKVDYKSLNEKLLTIALIEVLENSKYKNRVKYLSDLFRDRPMTALDTAVFWTEYVIRHHGAPHMHYPGADLNVIQRNSLDVIGFLLLILYLIAKFIKMIFKFICSMLCSSKTDNSLKMKKKKKA